MWSYLAGKKTYILAVVVIVVLIVVVFLGLLTPSLAVDVLVFAAPLFAVTFRDAIQKNHAQVLELLTDVATAGVDLQTHKTGALLGDVEKIAATAAPLLPASPPSGAVSVTFAGEGSQVVAAVSALQTKQPGILGAFPKAGSL